MQRKKTKQSLMVQQFKGVGVIEKKENAKHGKKEFEILSG